MVHITCFLLGLTSAYSLNTVSEIIAEVRATDLCVVLWVLEKSEVKSQQKERLKMVTFFVSNKRAKILIIISMRI